MEYADRDQSGASRPAVRREEDTARESDAGPSGAARTGQVSSAIDVVGLQQLAGNQAVQALFAPNEPTTSETAYPHRGEPDAQALPENPAATFNTLRARLVDARDEQRSRAESCKGDMKYWFALTYSQLTQRVLETVDAGGFVYPIAVMQLALELHARFDENLTAWRSAVTDDVASKWRDAFLDTDGGHDEAWYRTVAQRILSSLMPGMHDLVDFELPRALMVVYGAQYEGKPSVTLETFAADLPAMAENLEGAHDHVRSEIDETCATFDSGGWLWLAIVGFPAIYRIAVESKGGLDQNGSEESAAGDDWAATKIMHFDWNARV